MENLQLNYKLLNHPFYQSWTEGKITQMQLSKYAYAYLTLIEKMPKWWDKITDSFSINTTEAKEVIVEETEHIDLWKCWMKKLSVPTDYPSMQDTINQLDELTPSALLGAIHAFEIQQPEVAETKKEGLLKFYGFSENDTKYFDEHMNEIEHINLGEKIATENASSEEFTKGFELGSKVFYHALDPFCEK